MTTFYRAQTKGYTFEQLQQHSSGDGGDGLGEEFGGVCACSSPQDLLLNTVMGAMDEDDDVVIFEGIELAEVYDGYRVRPVREIARLTVAAFRAELAKLKEDFEYELSWEREGV